MKYNGARQDANGGRHGVAGAVQAAYAHPIPIMPLDSTRSLLLFVQEILTLMIVASIVWTIAAIKRLCEHQQNKTMQRVTATQECGTQNSVFFVRADRIISAPRTTGTNNLKKVITNRYPLTTECLNV